MKKRIGMIVLAAGQGKRLKWDCPKVLAPVVGRCLIDFPIESFFHFLDQQSSTLTGELSVVVGHRRQEVQEYLEQSWPQAQRTCPLQFVVQTEQRGTGDAIKAYFGHLKSLGQTAPDYTFVICGDTPLIRAAELQTLYETIISQNALGLVASFITAKPHGYGRICRVADQDRPGLTIVEEKDANAEIKKIQEVNSGFYIFKTSYLLEQVESLTCANSSNEFYLTDVFKQDRNVRALAFDCEQTFWGINDLAQLEMMEQLLLKEKIQSLRDMGVRFLDASSVRLDWSVEIGAGSTIYPGVVMEGRSSVGAKSVVESGVIIKNAQIGPQAMIKAYSYIDSSRVGTGAEIGPFARLRPDSQLADKVKVGNFVEVKKSTLERGVKVSHLSYVGDALIGENTNVGCGFITCNYDGIKKHKTTVGKNVFIGSDCQAVAPVTIGEGSLIAAGSTITNDVPAGALTIARSRQINKEGMASRFLPPKKEI